jgi:WD40 repeat protein
MMACLAAAADWPKLGRDHTRNPGSSGELKLWNMETGLEMLSNAGVSSSVYKSIFTPDGHQIIAAGRERAARIGKLLVFDSRPVGREVHFRSPDAALSDSATDR